MGLKSFRWYNGFFWAMMRTDNLSIFLSFRDRRNISQVEYKSN